MRSMRSMRAPLISSMRAFMVDDAGIVDHGVERAEAFVDRLEHRDESASLPTSACTANASTAARHDLVDDCCAAAALVA